MKKYTKRKKQEKKQEKETKKEHIQKERKKAQKSAEKEAYMREEIEFMGGESEEDVARAAKEALGDKYAEVVKTAREAIVSGGCGYIPGFVITDMIGGTNQEARRRDIPHILDSAYVFIRGYHTYVVFSEDVGPDILQEIFPQICYLSLATEEFSADRLPEGRRPEKLTIAELEDLTDDFLEGDVSFVFRNTDGAYENVKEYLGSVCELEAVGERNIADSDYIITSIWDDSEAVMTGVSEKAMLQASYVFEGLCEVDFTDKAIASLMFAELN